jgi:gamma-glutamylputrescine oxidase
MMDSGARPGESARGRAPTERPIGNKPGHAPSYYAATANAAPDRPALRGDTRADVCIIGAGFTGISAALHLAERGFSVVVLEAERVGWGASGRNGGQIVNGYSRDLDVIARRFGQDAASGLGRMALEGGDIIRQRVAAYGIDCALRHGGLIAAFTGRQMRHLEHAARVWAAHGHTELELLDRNATRKAVDTHRYAGALLDPKGGHIHPLNLVLGEAAAFESHGGMIHEASRAVSVDTGPAPVVRTQHGAVRADFVLVCGNAYLGGLLTKEVGRHIMPVSSQVVTTQVLDPALIQSLLPPNYCVEDCNYFLDYYRRTQDGRLLFGGGTVYGGRDPASIEAKLRPSLEKTFPQLKGVRLDFAWSGNFALTLTRIPHVGRISPTVLFSHGDSGHGVTTTHMLGKLLAEAVAGQAERFDIFANLPTIAFPGGSAFRVPLTVLGSWYYRLLDRLG